MTDLFQSASGARDEMLSRLRLIAITDAGVRPWAVLEGAVKSALAAGLPALMLRDQTLPDDELAPIGARLREATRRHGALLIVNRRLELACALEADAVQLGASGPTIDEAKQFLASGTMIGYSAHGVAEALAAFGRGADYVLFSPIFVTPSKRGILEPVGLEPLRELAVQAPGPVIALGGIDQKNISEVIRVGARGVAVIRAIFGATDSGQATRAMMESIASSRKTSK